jgi:hypothetical protein
MSGRHNGGGEPNKRMERVVVTVEQRRERLEVIEQLMIRGIGTSKIEKACADRFGMNKGAVARYMSHLREQWADEERQSRPTNKATAQRRIYQHIQKAREADNWAAVASLERLLSDIQGTKEALEVNLNVDANVREATLHVIANLTPEKRAEILAEQRKLRELAAMVDPSAVKPIVVPDALPSPVENLDD